jgi:glycosyltransferase involved in cell wall biosynthesis
MSSELPKISVITPSYNQGQFIEQTILSVLSQGYPKLEYIIMDGGSMDNTVKIIKKYEGNITHWQSKKDNGQASAINEGFALATGDILCWLNSDDMYLPGILKQIATSFTEINEAEIVFGNCIHFNSQNKKARGSDVVKAHLDFNISLCDYIIQPSSFYSRAAWLKTGKLNEELQFIFDWDWFIRAAKAGTVFTPMQDYFSLYRIHDDHKSGRGGEKRMEELKQIATMYNDKRLTNAFCKWIDLYARNNFISKTLDAAQRLNISAINTLGRLILFPQLNKKEYLNIVAMN